MDTETIGWMTLIMGVVLLLTFIASDSKVMWFFTALAGALFGVLFREFVIDLITESREIGEQAPAGIEAPGQVPVSLERGVIQIPLRT